MKKLILLFSLLLLSSVGYVYSQNNKRELSNLVCFVRFADEDASVFSKSTEHYQKIFNDQSVNANSVYNYFKQASYQQLEWNSVFYPASSNSTIVSFQAKNNRGYYLHYSSINPEGYVEDSFGANKLAREQNLVKEISDYLNTIVTADTKIDANNDGLIDNLCIIISKNSEISGKYLLWPHRSALYTKQGMIADKKVGEYLFLFDGQNGFDLNEDRVINTGVLCHEMSHTLGTYDLYHTAKDNLNPIGVWDLMSDNLLTPQQMSAYTKFKYCKWLNEIPEITQAGKYTLNPIGGTSSNQTAYKIKPIGSNEYFIVEYRKKEGIFDSGLPNSGLLVYRVNPQFTGNEGYDGSSKLDELYLFRPGGTITNDGNISEATFSAESGRTAFGGTCTYKPYYSNGTEAKFALANISSCGETIQFDLLPFAPQIYIAQNAVTLAGKIGDATQVKIEANTTWQISDMPDWLQSSTLSGSAGITTITLTTTKENKDEVPHKVNITLTSTIDPSITALISITQNSNAIQAPYGLNGLVQNNNIKISWNTPHEGTPVLNEGFENASNDLLWTVNSANGKKWTRIETKKNYLPYEGSFSYRVDGETIDRHQDEKLISPIFAYGKYLSFYSKSIAPTKKNDHNFYWVEISSDGGKTWKPLWDLKAKGTLINKYERINLDLSEYQSDNMRVAFHAWDDNQTGFSYWWQIDAISIYPDQKSTVSKYQVYRNNTLLGDATECSFTDSSPLPGVNIYTVKAITQNGETPLSEGISVNYINTAITSVTSQGVLVNVSSDRSYINVKSETEYSKVLIHSCTGKVVENLLKKGNCSTININNLSNGMYILSIYDNYGNILSRTKFMK